MSAVLQIAEQWNLGPGSVWYRGVNQTGLDLLPGVHRRRLDDEDSLTEDFLINYKPMHDRPVVDEWEVYALMQHYGMPTRLLDWTKVPLIALYFAVDGTDARHDRVVWVMDPFALNEHVHKSYSVAVPRSGKEEDHGIPCVNYLPKCLRPSRKAHLPAHPVAMEPPLSNRRILFQQGCFTLHGSNSKPIDAYFAKGAKSRISRVVVPARCAEKIMLQLRYLGYSEDYVYQDLPSLSKRIIRTNYIPTGKSQSVGRRPSRKL
jgi:hypothetical protein